MKSRIHILFVIVFISAFGIVSGQNFLNDTTGRIINRGILRLVADSAKFGNAQPNIKYIDNQGIIEFTGRYGTFTEPDFSYSFLGDAGSTALGTTVAFRVPGTTRYSHATADTQYTQARYFTNLELDKQAPKFMPHDIYVGGLYSVSSKSGGRRYEGTFHYDGSARQVIYPENSNVFRINRYYNLDLLVSDGSGQSIKFLDTALVARLDGVLTSSTQAPLTLAGSMLLGSDGRDTSVTNGTVDVNGDGLLEMGRRPIRYNADVTVTQGKVYAPDTAGSMHVTAKATLLLTGDKGKIDMRENTLMTVTGDYRNAGAGTNASFNKTSTVVFDGKAGQGIERTLASNPYGNVHTLLAKSSRGNVFVANNLTVENGDIQMNKDTLTMLDAGLQPRYVSGLEEVIGAMRRANIGSNSSVYGFNNAATNVTFSSVAATYPSEMTLTVTPLAAPSNPPVRYFNLTDVNRRIIVGYSDTSKQWQATFRVGYRDTEAANLDQSKLVFYENWADSAKEIKTDVINPAFVYSRQPTAPSAFGYLELPGIHAASVAGIAGSAVFKSGHDLVLRTSGPAPLIIFAKAFLEGAYRGNETMGFELLKRDLLPLSPPAMYPYNLDPARVNQTVTKIPDSVVDWVTLEFRSQLTGGARYYRNCFIRDNGTLVDFDGKSPIILPMKQPGDYYVILRHRNHLAVVTESPFALGAASTINTLDFSNPNIVSGGFSALKPVELIGTRYVYGLVAGDTDGNGIVNELDYTRVWNERDNENYLNSDSQMNGIVNTLDFNVSWNNRLRQTFVTP